MSNFGEAASGPICQFHGNNTVRYLPQIADPNVTLSINRILVQLYAGPWWRILVV